jgi:hypothetical protein
MRVDSTVYSWVASEVRNRSRSPFLIVCNGRKKLSRCAAIPTFPLETRELPIPVAGADEVLVHVEAAGVGVWDPYEREGGSAKQFNIKLIGILELYSD